VSAQPSISSGPAVPSAIPATAQPAEGSWEVTSPMAVARKGHTATLLPDGKVLVVGGVDSNDDASAKALASAELYDPKTGTWSETGSLIHPRAWHTATLLKNGLVLVAGGNCPGLTTKGCFAAPSLQPDWDPSGAIAAAELYDPKTGTWATTGSMTSPRFLHTATLLADGRVLVAGAELAPDWIRDTTEVYDPGTGRWMATGKLHTARWRQFAVALPDGGALVAGGYGVSPNTDGLLDSVELYSAATGSWRLGPSLLAGRAQGGAAVLLPTGSVLIAGGEGAGQVPGSAELYDPATGSRAAGAMGSGRDALGWASLPDGRLLVVGGFDKPETPDFTYRATAEIYDILAGDWHSAGAMQIAGFEFKATLLRDGRVLVTGGSASPADHVASGADTVSSSAEIWTP